MMNDEREDRMNRVNVLLRIIAACGHRFFHHEGRYARFVMDRRGRIWFEDAYTQRRIYTHHPWTQWRRGFTEGGTLLCLVKALQQFIMKAAPVPAHRFGPWPEWVCRGDPWGYGPEMEIVRAAARSLGIVAAPAEEEASVTYSTARIEEGPRDSEQRETSA